jgi:hypothetical protein
MMEVARFLEQLPHYQANQSSLLLTILITSHENPNGT